MAGDGGRETASCCNSRSVLVLPGLKGDGDRGGACSRHELVCVCVCVAVYVTVTFTTPSEVEGIYKYTAASLSLAARVFLLQRVCTGCVPSPLVVVVLRKL